MTECQLYLVFGRAYSASQPYWKTRWHDRWEYGQEDMRRVVGFLVFPGFQLLDLSGPLAAFEVAGKLVAGASYQLLVMSITGGPIKASCGLGVGTAPFSDEILDTLVVPGGAPCLSDVDPGLSAILKAASRRCRRVASVCTGAFLL